MATKKAKTLRIAIAQLPITDDIPKNSKCIRESMRTAAKSGARVVQFPEGMLTGYAQHPIRAWSEVNWELARKELEDVIRLAAELKVWVVVGSAHPLTQPHWPHNSLYVISDQGALVTRYDKRIVSHTEITGFYTPGNGSVVFDVDGFRFGCLICIEVNFPILFMEYARLGVDCLLLSAYPDAAMFQTKTQAHAAIHNYWIGLSTPTDTDSFIRSALIGPDGEIIKQMTRQQGLVIADIAPNDPHYEIPLKKAKPWRASVATDPRYIARLNDPRSVNRVSL